MLPLFVTTIIPEIPYQKVETINANFFPSQNLQILSLLVPIIGATLSCQPAQFSSQVKNTTNNKNYEHESVIHFLPFPDFLLEPFSTAW
jgi:hypothetical protein